MQQRDATRQVIEDEQGCRCDERGIGHALRGGVPRQPLEQAHDVITRHADEPARERQPVHVGAGPGRRRQRLAQRAEILILVGWPRPLLAVDAQGLVIHEHLERVAEADERIARESLSAFHTLEQETRLEVAQLQVRRHRRIEICGYVERCFHKFVP